MRECGPTRSCPPYSNSTGPTGDIDYSDPFLTNKDCLDSAPTETRDPCPPLPLPQGTEPVQPRTKNTHPSTCNLPTPRQQPTWHLIPTKLTRPELELPSLPDARGVRIPGAARGEIDSFEKTEHTFGVCCLTNRTHTCPLVQQGMGKEQILD